MGKETRRYNSCLEAGPNLHRATTGPSGCKLRREEEKEEPQS